MNVENSIGSDVARVRNGALGEAGVAPNAEPAFSESFCNLPKSEMSVNADFFACARKVMVQAKNSGGRDADEDDEIALYRDLPNAEEAVAAADRADYAADFAAADAEFGDRAAPDGWDDYEHALEDLAQCADMEVAAEGGAPALPGDDAAGEETRSAAAAPIVAAPPVPVAAAPGPATPRPAR